MDLAKFKEIFSKDDYQLPIRWDGKDFYATLYKHLKDYREDIEKNCDNPNLCAEVKAVCRGICFAVDHSFKGYPEKAYKSFEAVMEVLRKYPLLINKEDINKKPLYRVVDAGSAAVPKRQRVFHVPFNMRSKMSTQRYSIPGFPSLYLGTSLELCLMEIGKDPQRDYVCVSRYELQTDRRMNFSRWAENNQSPVFDNDKFIIFDISIKPEEAIKKLCNNEDIVRYIKWYPLISACSYIRAVRGDRIFYSPEYIVPQLFLQWVRSEDEDAVVGIKYFSCAPVYASSLGNNYVFPTMGVPNQVRNTIKNYCAKLSHRFKLTTPRFLMEYESIDDCEDAMIKDKELRYIEDYSTNEEEKIEGDYTIPEGVSAIGALAFSDCGSMTGINLPDSVTSIGSHAFYRCVSLTSINIPDNVTTIGNYAFSGCRLMTSISLPDSVTTIGDGAFFNCSSLTNVYLPDSVTSIGNFVFCFCTTLKSINIPKNITSIGKSAFYGCSSLTKITVDSSNEYYTSEDDILYNKSMTTLLCCPSRKKQADLGDFSFSDGFPLTNLIIPDSVSSIGESAFSECSYLISISIPDSVTSIGENAFSTCSSLTSINIPDSVTSIGDSIFEGCSSLTAITVSKSNEYYTSEGGILYSKNMTKLICFPAGKEQMSFAIPHDVTSIGDYAFYDCRLLTSINLPDSVTSIGDFAFYDCSSLKIIYYSGTQEQAESLFNNINEVGNDDLLNAEWKYGYSDGES